MGDAVQEEFVFANFSAWTRVPSHDEIIDLLHQLCSIIVKQEINVNRSTLKMNELERTLQSIDKKLEAYDLTGTRFEAVRNSTYG